MTCDQFCDFHLWIPLNNNFSLVESVVGYVNKAVDLIVHGYNTIINCMFSDSKNFFKPKKQDKTRVQRTETRTDQSSEHVTRSYLYFSMMSAKL